MSDSIKPIHFFKVLNEAFPIKKNVFENIHVEKNCHINLLPMHDSADFRCFGCFCLM